MDQLKDYISAIDNPAIFLEETWGTIDFNFGKIEESHNVNNPNPCAMCGRCCKMQTPVVHLFDISNIARWIHMNKDDSTKNNMLEILESNLKKGSWKRKEMGIGNSCGFYSKDGCSVYPVRPFVCRCYSVTRGSGKRCGMKNKDGSQIVITSSLVKNTVDFYDFCRQEFEKFLEDDHAMMLLSSGVLSILKPDNKISPNLFFSYKRGGHIDYSLYLDS